MSLPASSRDDVTIFRGLAARSGLAPVDSALEQRPLLVRLLEFVAPAAGADAHAIHNLHPYPAKYIAALPREVLLEHTNERHYVLDPFCGSGTTLVEAALLGRKSIGIDANPIACLISTAKTTPLTAPEQQTARTLAQRVRNQDPTELPRFTGCIIERQAHWFQTNMLRELAWLRSSVTESAKTEALRTFLLCVFSSIVTTASRQDSETRYVAVDKDQPDGYALSRFARRLEQGLLAGAEYSESSTAARNVPTVIHSSVDAVKSRAVKDRSIDLVMTSPPYPNSYDYYLYHKLRMAWLGYDWAEAKRLEVGSRYEHSSDRASIDVFTRRMEPLLANVRRMLKPSKLAYFFVGDAILQGKLINMADLYADLGLKVGLRVVDETSYDLGAISRSFRDTRNAAGNGNRPKKGRPRKCQRVIVFERETATAERRPRGRASASPIPIRRPVELSLNIPDGATVALCSNDADRHVHALAPFPSKFIPEVPRWAMSHYTEPGDLVLDPFAGSGTTAVEATLLERDSVSVDINPYACLLTEAKTSRAPVDGVERSADELLKFARGLAVDGSRQVISTGVTRASFDLDTFWFDPLHLTQFAQLHAFVQTKIDGSLQPLFRVALGSLIRHFSFQDTSQIKVKRDPKKVLRGTPTPVELLMKRLPALVGRFIALQDRVPPLGTATVQCDSADRFAVEWIKKGIKVDAIVTSPPYINAMNYPMATRYELLLLGLVDPDELRPHQATYFGTERVYAKDFNILHQVPEHWTCAEYLNPRLSKIFLQEPKRAYIAYSYFERMAATLQSLATVLKPGGRFVLVAGTNRIRGVPIDTFQVLTSLLEDAGLTRELSFHYEIVKQMFKITRHETGATIPSDGVAVLVA
jgi:DNA modification methylase